MPRSIKVTISTHIQTTKGLSQKDAAAFRRMVPSGRLVTIQAGHNAKGLQLKEAKELDSVCKFAERPEFQPTIKRLMGTDPGSVFHLDMLAPDDPPDFILKLGGRELTIDVTDFPPDRTAKTQAIFGVNRVSQLSALTPTPAFYEGGCNPQLIEQFMRKPLDFGAPHFSDLHKETVALSDCAKSILCKKDDKGKSAMLLMHGPLDWGLPAEVIKHHVETLQFQTLKCVVFLAADGAHIHWTNRA